MDWTPPGPARFLSQVIVTPTSSPRASSLSDYLVPAGFSLHCRAALGLLTLITSLHQLVLPHPSMKSPGTSTWGY